MGSDLIDIMAVIVIIPDLTCLLWGGDLVYVHVDDKNEMTD